MTTDKRNKTCLKNEVGEFTQSTLPRVKQFGAENPGIFFDFAFASNVQVFDSKSNDLVQKLLTNVQISGS